ncbi:hypothetical protein H0H92_002701 [Tricholoma furcatifolium]|nr:hypothetical protein H0H92_002701 [Tricholoma furcatifolium]
MPSELPPEIEDAIFELAARMSPRDAPKLSIVSKRIQDRVERVIYESLFFVQEINRDNKGEDTACFERILPTFHARPTEFFAKCVKNVFFPYTTPLNTGKIILSKCTRIQHLMYWISSDCVESRLCMPSLTHSLKSLIGNTYLFAELFEAGLVFPNLNFLFFIDRRISHLYRITTFAWLPQLEIIITHIPINLEDLEILVYTTPKLKTLFLDAWRDMEEEVEEWGRELSRSIDVRVNDPASYGAHEAIWRTVYETTSLELVESLQRSRKRSLSRLFPKQAPKFSIVSKRVQDRVERVIYESLFLVATIGHPRFPDTACIERILPTIRERPAEYFAERVKNIFFPHDIRFTEVHLILTKCTRIRHLIYWLSPTADALPWFPPLTQTLQSLMTDTLLLMELHKVGFIFPSVRFMFVTQIQKSNLVAISTFEWLPELEIACAQAPLRPEDLDVLVYTAPKLKTFHVRVCQEEAVYGVEKWAEGLQRSIEVRINDPAAHQFSQHVWRMAYKAVTIDDLRTKLRANLK